MTQIETEIMRDAFRFFSGHEPPPADSPESAAFWKKTADDLAAAGVRWKHHPLAREVFVAVYLYLEIKQKEAGK